jgi:hypothetical protein
MIYAAGTSQFEKDDQEGHSKIRTDSIFIMYFNNLKIRLALFKQLSKKLKLYVLNLRHLYCKFLLYVLNQSVDMSFIEDTNKIHIISFSNMCKSNQA